MTETTAPMHAEAQGAAQKTKARIGRPPKPFCRHGHAMTDENIYRKGKQRKCLTCRADRARRTKALRAAGGKYRKKVSDDPLYYRRSQLKRLYGLTHEEYTRMLDEQGGTCAICKQPPGLRRGAPATMCVDHDHATGWIRGLLCHRCNVSLHVVEDAKFVEVATRYLRDHGPKL